MKTGGKPLFSSTWFLLIPASRVSRLQSAYQDCDPSFRQRQSATTVVCFAKEASSIPRPDIGSVLLLRDIKVARNSPQKLRNRHLTALWQFGKYNGDSEQQGTGYSNDPWVAYVYDPSMPEEMQPQCNAGNTWKPSDDDLRHLNLLVEWWKVSKAELTPQIGKHLGSKSRKPGRVSLGLPLAQSASTTPASVTRAPTDPHTERGLCLIRDVAVGDSFHAVVEVSPTLFASLRQIAYL